jgi:hypothetical protein
MDVDEACGLLDRFDVPGRLQHVRRYIWRNGALQRCVEERNVFYQLQAGGEVLRIGINLAMPSAMYVRSRHVHSVVPFAGRFADDVERALQKELDDYASSFLGT